MRHVHLFPLPWGEPAQVLAAWADEPFAVGLLSDSSSEGRWSYVARRPVSVFENRGALADGLARWRLEADEGDGPPFRGGAIGLAAYEWGASLEPTAPQTRTPQWPDLIGGIYPQLFAFDHHKRRAWAIARGDTALFAEAAANALAAEYRPLATDNAHHVPGAGLVEQGTGDDYRIAVAAVVEAVASGEIFQANIARRWSGVLDAMPMDVCAALLRRSPAPFAAYLRLPGLALVSNSPERFMSVTADGVVRTQPIKGTRPRGATPAQDAALAAELLASAKDRAENLMIVDLMRNDLARACLPGTVAVPELCGLRSFANVHHLVSTVTGRLAPQRTALDAFAGAFPPGSVTGAPKLQAMAVIARHEPPRGPYCGSLFWAGFNGAFDSSVLIRTLAFDEAANGGWRFEGRAGAAITSDSVPAEEEAETDAKFSALRAVLTGA